MLQEYITKKIGHMLKLIVLKFRSDLSGRLKDIAEKHVREKLKPLPASFPGEGLAAGPPP